MSTPSPHSSLPCPNPVAPAEPRPTVLLLGASGQIGWELSLLLARVGTLVAPSHQEADLSDLSAVRALLKGTRPNLVVNAAAYTAVDRAEREPDAARRLNAELVHVLATECHARGAAMVHFSTDYVFDGRKPTAYVESDAPNPLSVYGQTKLEGEQAVTASGVSALVIRTSWVYAMRGRNFVLNVLRQAAESRPMRIVNDQFGAPTWARIVAQTTATMIGHSLEHAYDRWSFGRCAGMYHVTCAGRTNWHEAALAVLHWAGYDPVPEIAAIRAEDYGAAARRPGNSTLDCHLVEERFGVRLPQWEAALEQAMSEGASTRPAPASRKVGLSG